MIGVAIPAHNEAQVLALCLQSVLCAARALDSAEEVRVVVILDSCTDGTREVAEVFGVDVVATGARNVGHARAAGADYLLSLGVRWLAFTDADTEVGPDWLKHQLALGSDAVCGTVAVRDWSCHGSAAVALAAHFAASYTDADGHRHIHGANLGVCAQAYRRAGGFAPLACHEDVALVRALEQSGARIAWSARPRVFTSARRQVRARGGFGDALLAAATPLALAWSGACVQLAGELAGEFTGGAGAGAAGAAP